MDGNMININRTISDEMSGEAYNTLRTNLLYVKDLQVITISSSSANEGKTVTAFNLAKSFAKIGKKVVLIDCDLRRSSLRKYLLIKKNQVGLSEYLSNQSALNVNKTNIKNLDVVLAGKVPPNPSDLLTSDSLAKALEELKKVYDYVIIDTPPVGVAMDAVLVAKETDGVLFVIRNNFSHRRMIKHCKQELERNGCRILGVVLNGVKRDEMRYSYGSYSGYYEEY